MTEPSYHLFVWWKDISTEVRSAIVAAVVGLLIAVPGVGGTLYVANRQIDEESRRSHAEFFRNTRRDAYAQVLSAIIETNKDVAIIGLIAGQFDKGLVDLATLLSAIDTYDARANDLGSVFATVLLVGTPEASDALGVARNVIDKIGPELRPLYDVAPGNAQATYDKSVAPHREELVTAIDKLTSVARTDVAEL